MGWKSCIYCLFCFSFSFYVVFCCFLFFFLCFRLVFLSFCIYNRNTHIKTTKTLKGQQTNIKKQKKHKYPSQTLRYIYLSRRFVGLKSCISVVSVVLLVFLFFVCFFLFVFMFSPSLFKLLHLQSKQHIKT